MLKGRQQFSDKNKIVIGSSQQMNNGYNMANQNYNPNSFANQNYQMSYVKRNPNQVMDSNRFNSDIKMKKLVKIDQWEGLEEDRYNQFGQGKYNVNF